MMLALWAAVTFLRPFSSAYLKADSTIRSEPNTEIGLIEMPDSSRVGESSSSARKVRSFSTSAEPFSNSMPGVEVLGVLADDHDVGLGEARAHALVGLAGADAGVEVELLAEGDVDRAEARAHRGGRRALDGDPALADRVERAVGERVALRLVDVDAGVLEVPVELDSGGLEHAPRGLRELGPGAVARDEGDSMRQNGPFS